MKEYLKKVCICGDSAVGKTSLIRRFVTGMYKEKYITTLGTVISKKIVEMPERDFKINMQIWDISGQAEFKRIQASAFRHCQGALAVCDIIRPETAMNLYTWITNIRKYSNEKVPVIVLINKFDLIDRKKDNMEKIEKILENIGCLMFATSAKTGHNVELGFTTLAESIVSTSMELPKSALDLVAMPEIFENPYALLDYILMRFTKTFGDEEMSIHLIRKQAEARGKDFNKLPREETMLMIDHFLSLISNYKGEEEARALRLEFTEAYNRCQW